MSAAIAFGYFMPNWTPGENAQKEFFAGWLTEYALSVDNIFVFVIILSRLQIDKTKQQLVLLLGIIIALVLRGVFIAAGTAIITRFSSAFFIFGAFLIYTAYKLLREDGNEEEEQLLRKGTEVACPLAANTAGNECWLHRSQAFLGVRRSGYQFEV